MISSHVIVTAKLVKGASDYLTDKTRFWVVRASVKAGQVSGLGTLLSGAYIGIDPVTEGESTRHFEGLDTPPVVTTGQPGRHFVLKADKRGSLDVGSPVFYRQIQVGEVVAYDIGEDAESIDFKVFVHAPYDEKVRENTRFWNASGLDVSVTAQGIKVDTESMVSILIGGIAFAAPENEAPGAAAEEEHVFHLYDNHEATREKEYAEKRRFLLYFDGSVRGLSPGASVEFRGIQIGEVVDVKLEFNVNTRKFQIPVVIDIEPERVAPTGQIPPEWARLERHERQNRVFDQLVAQGMRAQLKTGSLITGKLYVDMDIYEKVEDGRDRLQRDLPGAADRTDLPRRDNLEGRRDPRQAGAVPDRQDRQEYGCDACRSAADRRPDAKDSGRPGEDVEHRFTPAAGIAADPAGVVGRGPFAAPAGGLPGTQSGSDTARKTRPMTIHLTPLCPHACLSAVGSARERLRHDLTAGRFLHPEPCRRFTGRRSRRRRTAVMSSSASDRSCGRVISTGHRSSPA